MTKNLTIFLGNRVLPGIWSLRLVSERSANNKDDKRSKINFLFTRRYLGNRKSYRDKRESVSKGKVLPFLMIVHSLPGNCYLGNYSGHKILLILTSLICKAFIKNYGWYDFERCMNWKAFQSSVLFPMMVHFVDRKLLCYSFKVFLILIGFRET